MPWIDTGLVRQLHQYVHDRASDLLEVAAADRVLEEHVAREAGLAVDDEGEVVVLVPRSLQRPDREPTGLEVALHDRDAIAGSNLVVACDVIGIGVGREQMGDRQAVPLDGLEERLERRPAIDEHSRPADLVADDVGVGKPARIHAAVNEHRR